MPKTPPSPTRSRSRSPSPTRGDNPGLQAKKAKKAQQGPPQLWKWDMLGEGLGEGLGVWRDGLLHLLYMSELPPHWIRTAFSILLYKSTSIDKPSLCDHDYYHGLLTFGTPPEGLNAIYGPNFDEALGLFEGHILTSWKMRGWEDDDPDIINITPLVKSAVVSWFIMKSAPGPEYEFFVTAMGKKPKKGLEGEADNLKAIADAHREVARSYEAAKSARADRP